jgi:cytochrome c553
MRNRSWVLLLALFVMPAFGAEPPQQGSSSVPPPWAYGFATPADPANPPPAAPGGGPAPDNGAVRQLPGSTLSFTVTQIRDSYGPADWYPNEHPQMPDIVAHGRKPDIIACSLCHYPNGKGRSENAGIAGLPYTYFLQTMSDFKNDARHSSDSRKANTNQMIHFAKTMSDDELKAAAQYFSSLKWTPWVKVVETTTVPKTRSVVGLVLRLEGDATEPLGQRIIEVPVNTEGTEVLRDPHSGFIAYAPVGSIKKGEDLVMNGGGGKTTQCTICHGTDLQGLGPVPGIGGRSPSYLTRQLYDMQSGTRSGVWTNLMKPVVSKLSPEDMVNIAAYLASRDVPQASAPSTAASTGSPKQGPL